MTCPHCDQYRTQLAAQHRAFADHDPAATTLRLIAPFVRDALDQGVWTGDGADTIRRELDHTLAWLDQKTPS